MIREALRAIFEAVEADEHLIAERDRAIGQLARAERRRDAEVARAEKAEAKLDEALKQRRLIEDSFTKLRYDVLAVARELHALVRSGRAHPGNLVLQQYAAAVESAAEKLDLAAYLRAGESPTNTREPEPEPKYREARIIPKAEPAPRDWDADLHARHRGGFWNAPSSKFGWWAVVSGDMVRPLCDCVTTAQHEDRRRHPEVAALVDEREAERQAQLRAKGGA